MMYDEQQALVNEANLKAEMDLSEQRQRDLKRLAHMALAFTNGDVWQRCPICNGSGLVAPTFQPTSKTLETCSVCLGNRIISILTGKPPG